MEWQIGSKYLSNYDNFKVEKFGIVGIFGDLVKFGRWYLTKQVYDKFLEAIKNFEGKSFCFYGIYIAHICSKYVILLYTSVFQAWW